MVEDQDAVAEDAVDEVGRGPLQVDELHRRSEVPLQPVFEAERRQRVPRAVLPKR